MKKSLILVLFALVSVVSYSQVSWNAKVGMNMSNISNMDGDVKIGYNLGVGMEYAFTDMWSIQPSLLFSTKGTKSEATIEGYTDKVSFNPLYLELPIMFAARFAVSDNMNIVVSAGPYLAYGVGGKAKYEYSYEGESEEYEYDIFKDQKDEDGEVEEKGAKRFDAGLGVGVAWEINKFFVGVNGSFGLAKLGDVYDENDKKESMKNTNFSIGVGYKF